MNRGRRSEEIFFTDADSEEFLKVLHEAGIVKTLDEFPWISHKAYLSKANKWSWLQKELRNIEKKATKNQKRNDPLS